LSAVPDGPDAPRGSSAAQRSAERLLDLALARIDLKLGGLEAKVDALSTRLTHLHTPTLLVGHAEITRYCRKRPSTIQRYVRFMGFPALRWGRHVVSSPAMIDGWLIAVAQRKRDAKAARHGQSRSLATPPPKG